MTKGPRCLIVFDHPIGFWSVWYALIFFKIFVNPQPPVDTVQMCATGPPGPFSGLPVNHQLHPVFLPIPARFHHAMDHRGKTATTPEVNTIIPAPTSTTRVQQIEGIREKIKHIVPTSTEIQ